MPLIPIRLESSSLSLQTSDDASAVLAADNPQHIKSFATPDNGVGTNASYDFYTVPANKVFVVTSCICHENTTQAGNIQFVALREVSGAGKVANAYLYGGEGKELITTPIPFAAGTIVNLKTGGAVTATIAQIQGYLTDPSTAPAPEQTQIKTTPLG